MKLAFDHQVFAQQRFGGISRYFVELASRLPDCGNFDVTVIAPFHQNEYLAAADIEHRITFAKLTPGRIGIKRVLRWANHIALPLAWSGTSFDIIHETFFSVRVYGRARRRVLTVYDMIHELFPGRLARTDRVVAAKRAAVMRADHIICISETTRRDLVRLLGVDPAKTSVIYLGHALTQSSSADGSESPTAAPALRDYLLYVGDRGSYKNFGAAVEAYAHTARVRDNLRLVAFGGRPFTARELQWFAALGVAERVSQITGDDRRLAACYREARLFICPSTYEGFGLPPLEAMAHGCPVVCSDRGSIPEIVGEAGEYFDPTQRDQIAHAIERVAFSDARRAELSRLGLARAARFTWEKCAAETAAVYQRLI